MAIWCGCSIAGKGSLMTLTNMDTDAAISLKAYGFSAQLTGFDGTITETITGHVLVNMLPTDVPAGPLHDAVRRTTCLHDRSRSPGSAL